MTQQRCQKEDRLDNNMHRKMLHLTVYSYLTLFVNEYVLTFLLHGQFELKL